MYANRFSKRKELINLIKSTSLDYSQTTPELNEYGSWCFDMNGPTLFCWDTSKLANMSEEKLYEFYHKLRSGDFTLPAYRVEQTYEMKQISLPIVRQRYPKLSI